jgi:hypothetical protein
MTTLHSRMSTVQSTNPFFSKDLLKSSKATKFIGRGSTASSTNKYRVAAGDMANCGAYSAQDVVFVSAEGARRGRIEVDFDELGKAVLARVAFVTDNAFDRGRSYNIGERVVATFLADNGYTDQGGGIWRYTGA